MVYLNTISLTTLGHGQSGISSSELSLLMQVSEIETNYATLTTRSVAANVFLRQRFAKRYCCDNGFLKVTVREA